MTTEFWQFLGTSIATVGSIAVVFVQNRQQAKKLDAVKADTAKTGNGFTDRLNGKLDSLAESVDSVHRGLEGIHLRLDNHIREGHR